MIDRDFREKLLIYKTRNSLTYKELGDEIHTSPAVARAIVIGKREFVTLETAGVLISIVAKIEAESKA